MAENPETCMVEVRCENFARSFEKDCQGRSLPKTKKRWRNPHVCTFVTSSFFLGGTFLFGFVAGVSILSFRIKSGEVSAKVCQVDQGMTKQPMGLVRYCIFFLKICLIFMGSINIGIDILSLRPMDLSMDPLKKMVCWSKSRSCWPRLDRIDPPQNCRKRPSLPQESSMRSYLNPPFPSDNSHGEFTLQNLRGITRNVCFQLLFLQGGTTLGNKKVVGK